MRISSFHWRDDKQPLLDSCAYALNDGPMSASERLLACNCFASRKAARLITKLYEDHLARVDLTSTQFSILVYVDEVEAASMKGLVATMAMERTSVIRALQPLRRDGLVAIGPHAEDARRNVVRLTGAGRDRQSR